MATRRARKDRVRACLTGASGRLYGTCWMCTGIAGMVWRYPGRGSSQDFVERRDRPIWFYPGCYSGRWAESRVTVEGPGWPSHVPGIAKSSCSGRAARAFHPGRRIRRLAAPNICRKFCFAVTLGDLLSKGATYCAHQTLLVRKSVGSRNGRFCAAGCSGVQGAMVDLCQGCQFRRLFLFLASCE